MNVEIVAEAAQFPEKEYMNGIAVAVYLLYHLSIPVLGWSPYLAACCGISDILWPAVLKLCPNTVPAVT